MTTGGFGVLFRTGATSGTQLELLLNSMLDARGSAITAEPGTVAWVEAMAFARALFSASETLRRLLNQFNPLTVTSELVRWEKIMGISPGSELTENERRRLLAAKWKLFGKSPIEQTTYDVLAATLGPIFVSILHIPSSKATMSLPGGLTVPGGNTIADGPWYSSVAHVPIRVSQPLAMTDAEFISKVALFLPFFYDMMPAYTTYNWGTYSRAVGTVSISAGTTTLTGVGTHFLTTNIAVVAGDEIEVRDISGTLYTLIVASVASDTSLTVVTPLATNVLNSYWGRFGFFLDAPKNLDYAFLR